VVSVSDFNAEGPGSNPDMGVKKFSDELVNIYHVLSCSFLLKLCVFVVSVCIN